jgi:polysaccharide biosynthesis protein PslG
MALARRRLVRIAAFGAAILAACTSFGERGTTEMDASSAAVLGGFSEGWSIRERSDTELARGLNGMVEAGATYLRIDIDWSVVQATGPRSWQWASTDRVIRASRARGLRVLGVLDYTPAWARPPGTSNKTPPTDPEAFANFARAAARRYARKGVHEWEIWNEPNSDVFWKPLPDPAAYTALLRAAHDAIKATDSDATVITGGLSPAADRADGTTIAPVSFLRGVYAAGGRGSFDAVGHHPYNYPNMPMTPEPGNYNWNAFGGVTPVLHQTMEANGDGAKKVWGTEMGAPTPWEGMTYDYLAAYVREAYTAWGNWSFTGPLIWYTYFESLASPADIDRYYALVSADFTPKGDALSVLASMLRETK